ncbi:hypothetical protein [Pedobacter cryoconitis]|uniref:hypothetical protein n=1 Tax=Pedobacter cryoconitis TaxID=188932 RepID=UPI00160B1276|nr:hypothetical protein [Pedobacter cryoconitis]MBB5645123.1 chorismate mutase [Pedobacter cryoconitis]
MRKFGIICLAIMLFGIASANAQGILDKIDRTINKADRAGNTADRAGKTGGKFSKLFGKKKGAEDAGAETKTIVNISGVDFATLKSINEKIEGTKRVANSKMKFSTSGSTISFQHSGTTADLLKALQKNNPEVFSEKNIEALEDGQISVQVKK